MGFKAHYHFNLKVPKARKFGFKAANLARAGAGGGVGRAWPGLEADGTVPCRLHSPAGALSLGSFSPSLKFPPRTRSFNVC